MAGLLGSLCATLVVESKMEKKTKNFCDLIILFLWRNYLEKKKNISSTFLKKK